MADTRVESSDRQAKVSSRSAEASSAEGEASRLPNSYMVGGSAERQVLIVSGHSGTRSKLHRYLLRHGLATTAISPDQIHHSVDREPFRFGLILLDLTGAADDHEAFGQVQSMRTGASTMVILDGSSLSTTQEGAERGADDFIVQPFSMAELSTRVDVLLAGVASPAEPNQHAAGNLTFDLDTRSCYRDGQCVGLTAREFDLLEYLVRRRGDTVSRARLATEVWGGEQAIASRTIDRHVTTIRRKIEDDPSIPVHLQTVYGEGYRFMATP